MTILIILFQFTWATLLLGRTDRHTRNKSLSKMMKKGSRWRKMTTLPLLPQARQFLPPRAAMIKNEHNMWNSLLELFCHVQVGFRMDTLVDEVATARAALSCHFALDSSCDKSGSCWFPQKRLPWKLSRSDTFVAAHVVPAQTFSVDDLFGTLLVLHWWEASHTQTIGLCRQTVQESSVDRRHADLHRFHFGLFVCERKNWPASQRPNHWAE